MLLCFISGILTGFTFVFKEICFISLITLIPFITSVEKGKRSFLKGAVFASSLNIVTMSFLFNMHPMEFMGLTGFKSLGTVFLMYFGIVLFEGLLGGLFTYIFSKYVKNIWFFPLCYTIYEFIIGLGEFGLTLSNLYLPWYNNLAFIQSAQFFSSYFLTGLIVLINVLIYKFIFLKNIKYLYLAILIFALNVSVGALRLNLYNPEEFKYDIALIQGNLSSLEKWENNSLRKSFEIYQDLTEEVKQKYDVDAVVWPETVINSEIYPESFWYKKLSSLSKEENVEIYAGCFYKEEDGYYNSMIAFNKKGKEYNDVYHKRHLIPFAENEYFFGNGLKEGKEAIVINTDLGKIGGLICIDSAYPCLSYKTNSNECDYFLVITNDSWFTDSFGVENHFAHSVFRAVENNKYVLRAGNTGITGVITPKGEVKGKIPPIKRGYTVVKGGKVTSYEK